MSGKRKYSNIEDDKQEAEISLGPSMIGNTRPYSFYIKQTEEDIVVKEDKD